MMCGYNKKKIWAGVMGVEYPPKAGVQREEIVMNEYSNQPGFISILDFIETPLHAKDKLTELCAPVTSLQQRLLFLSSQSNCYTPKWRVSELLFTEPL